MTEDGLVALWYRRETYLTLANVFSELPPHIEERCTRNGRFTDWGGLPEPARNSLRAYYRRNRHYII